jgi:hypothetical protein
MNLYLYFPNLLNYFGENWYKRFVNNAVEYLCVHENWLREGSKFCMDINDFIYMCP